MTTSEQDKELREKVAGALRTGYHGIAETKVINHIMRLITADRKRVVLEARIDELNRVKGTFYRDGMHIESKHWVQSRIDELTKGGKDDQPE